jgi:trans-aconitate methyltransferase
VSSRRPSDAASGSGQRWDPDRYRSHAAFVPALGEPLIALLAPRPDERILDLGCGEGALTDKLAALAAVVGIDASAEQVAAARARGLDARVGDGGALAFDAEFDAVFSNAALHWMGDQDKVIDGVFRALRPGGRFVAECGGEGNVETVRRALRTVFARRGLDAAAADPWTFLSAAEYRARLERRGFAVRYIALFPRPTPLPGALGDWLDTFAESFFRLVPESERSLLKAEIEDEVSDRLRGPDGRWTVDYVRLRFVAAKPVG